MQIVAKFKILLNLTLNICVKILFFFATNDVKIPFARTKSITLSRFFAARILLHRLIIFKHSSRTRLRFDFILSCRIPGIVKLKHVEHENLNHNRKRLYRKILFDETISVPI